jgi:archaellum component FlaC
MTEDEIKDRLILVGLRNDVYLPAREVYELIQELEKLRHSYNMVSVFVEEVANHPTDKNKVDEMWEEDLESIDKMRKNIIPVHENINMRMDVWGLGNFVDKARTLIAMYGAK